MSKVMLLDIEGTTTPIDFVHKTLFPFARTRIKEFVCSNTDDLTEELSLLKVEATSDAEFGSVVESVSDAVEYLQFLIDVDRKSTPLKSIQGKIWKEGYQSGSLLSEVYEDVVEAMRRWKKEGRSISIYSSGSVQAQKLLFRYSDKGDLTGLIDGYFDTVVGHKKEIGSYLSIIDSLGVEGEDVIFISDVLAELRAAKNAGLKTKLSIRPGNPEISESHSFESIRSFLELE